MAIMQWAGAVARQTVQGVAGINPGFHWAAHLTLALGLACACIGWKQAVTSAKLERVQMVERNTRGVAAARLYRDQQRQATSKATDRAVARLTAAAASNPTWADQPVPQDVQDALAP